MLGALKKDIGNAAMCDAVCNALWTITLISYIYYNQIKCCNIFLLVDDNKIIAREVGVIGVLLEVLKEHIKNDVICKYGCGALNNITENGKILLC